MLKTRKINKSKPYSIFLELLKSAKNKNQSAIDVIAISSLDKKNVASNN
mgnify:CR=1 FL=1